MVPQAVITYIVRKHLVCAIEIILITVNMFGKPQYYYLCRNILIISTFVFPSGITEL